ncbi:Chloronitrobenzene nitroreductase [Nymphon striatum]|nr:Chloronitrobenzene nitroreductase [Nymphon striatum]
MTPDLKDRQRRAGYALYESLGIGRRDVSGRRKQFAKNYAFFGAPVGVVVTIERAMGKGCFMDLGMAIMAFFLGAEDEGFGTTGIGALANYGPIVHEHLNLPEDEMVIAQLCGLPWPRHLGQLSKFPTLRTACQPPPPSEGPVAFDATGDNYIAATGSNQGIRQKDRIQTANALPINTKASGPVWQPRIESTRASSKAASTTGFAISSIERPAKAPFLGTTGLRRAAKRTESVIFGSPPSPPEKRGPICQKGVSEAQPQIELLLVREPLQANSGTAVLLKTDQGLVLPV